MQCCYANIAIRFESILVLVGLIGQEVEMQATRYLRRLGLALLALCFALTLAPAQASAQAVACGPHAKVVDRLFDRYNEKRIALALTSGGQLLEILVSPKGSWTIIITQPNGPSCLVSSGDNWQSILPLPGAEGPST
jgi:hypothetical protein